MELLQLWHGAAAVEDQMLKLPAPGVKLVPRNCFGRDRSAPFIDFVSQVSVVVQGGPLKLAGFPFVHSPFSCETLFVVPGLSS